MGQLLQHVSKRSVACAGSRPKTITQTYNKEMSRASEPFPLINYEQTSSPC